MVQDVIRKKNEKLFLGTNNAFVFKVHKLLNKVFWNPGNIYAGLKYCNRKRFKDGFFGKNYVYISNERYIRVKKFYDYLTKNDCYQKLIEGLNPESIRILNNYYYAINYILQNRDLCLPYKLLQISNNPRNNEIKKNIKICTKNFYIPGELLIEVRFYKHGLYQIPNVFKYTKGKDIIDCGAFIGDSALMFSKELNINKIFSLEPDPNTFKKLNKVIEKNHLKNIIIPINLGVGSKKCELKFNAQGMGTSSISENGYTKIKIDKLDNIVKGNNINPGLIKWDIEGAEYDSILGAEETIKKFKPILLISIYHTPKDFFEIKPLIESWNLGYKFKIVHCQEGVCYYDILLVAYIED